LHPEKILYKQNQNMSQRQNNLLTGNETPDLGHAVFLSYENKAASDMVRWLVALLLFPRAFGFLLGNNSEKNAKRLPTYFLSRCINLFPWG
jgi:hypothetical protein